MNKISDLDIFKLSALMAKANVLPEQRGYWDDLQYKQGAESLFRAHRIADVQDDPAIAKEIVDFVNGCNEIMTVNGAWYVNQLPTMVVVELADGSLGMFNLTPFRAITETDIKPYKGYHPRKMKGHPLPDYLYRFYGLERNEETLSEVIRVRVSPSEKEKLEVAASNEDKTVSEFVRDHIRGL